MIPFLCAAGGAVTGCAVCAFGMWAFLKGQRAALQVKWGGLPDELNIKAGTQESKEKSAETPDIAAQFHAMFGGEGGE